MAFKRSGVRLPLAPPNQPSPSFTTNRKALHKYLFDGDIVFPCSLPFAIMSHTIVGRFGGKKWPGSSAGLPL